QAGDGIRDFHVTGVQTCALPILPFGRKVSRDHLVRYAGKLLVDTAEKKPEILQLGASRRNVTLAYLDIWGFTEVTSYASPDAVRSEERRVGKERRSRRSRRLLTA